MTTLEPQLSPLLRLSVQYATMTHTPPARPTVRTWVKTALAWMGATGEITVRFVAEKESRDLNQQYRQKPAPTNVLSFDYRDVGSVAKTLFGDIVICSAVVAREAKKYQQPLLACYAHMVIHGVLHLAGYQHDSATDAAVMEAAEKNILAKLKMGDPYA